MIFLSNSCAGISCLKMASRSFHWDFKRGAAFVKYDGASSLLGRDGVNNIEMRDGFSLVNMFCLLWKYLMRSKRIIMEIIWNIYWKIRTHSYPIHQSFFCERLQILLGRVRQNFSCEKLQSQLCRVHQNFFSQMHWTWLCQSRQSSSFRKCSRLKLKYSD